MYIRVNVRDNVAIIVHPEGVAAGASLPGGLTARERIPQAHKIALHDLEAGEPVLRYGQTIGLANRPIPAGTWVREETIDLPVAPPLDRLPLATAVPAALPIRQVIATCDSASTYENGRYWTRTSDLHDVNVAL